MSAFTPNPGQARAIGAPPNQPVRVVAGAGTGKTEVIARRYLQLLQLAPPLRPAEILVLTFSEKAAAEMRARIFRAVSQAGLGFERLDLAAAPISTFHSFCARLLGDHSLRARIDPGLALLSEVDVADLLAAAQERFLATGFREAYGDFDPLTVDGYAWEDGKPFGVAQTLIDQLRNQAIDSAGFAQQLAALATQSDQHRVLGPLVSWLYGDYLEQLSRRGQLDFDRLIMDAAALLEQAADMQAAFRAQYRAILVDEYQDTNYAQERLLRALAAPGMPNVTVVGDPRQAIYVWREARVENIAGFPGAGQARFEAPLVENRRSLRPILDVANRAIGGYELGTPPEFSAEDVLMPFAGHVHFDGDVVTLQASITREAEAQAVVGWVQQARAAGYAYRDIALLLRARTYLPTYVVALQAAGIPLEISAGDAFYTRPEILDAIHLLQVCVNPGAELSLVRVLMSPAVGLSQPQVARLRQGQRRPLWRAVLDPAASGLDAEALARLQGLVVLWREAQLQLWTVTPAAFAGWVLRRSGLAAVPDPTAQRALRKLLAMAHGYEGEHPAHGLPELVDYLQRLLEADTNAKAPELNSQADAVQVMTAHASKGLEFPVVIAADSRQKVSPSRSFAPFHDPEAGLVIPNSAAKEAGVPFNERMRRMRNEGRCLWYVTLTRAKRRLIITATNDTERLGGRYEKEKTFFEELWNREAEAPSPGVILADAPADEPIVIAAASVPVSDDTAAMAAAQVLQAKLQARLGGVQASLGLDWSGAWSEAIEYTQPECVGLLDACQKAGTAAPVVGYELANAAGRVTGQAELAWPAAKVAVLLNDESTTAFAQAGWRAFAAADLAGVLGALDDGEKRS